MKVTHGELMYLVLVWVVVGSIAIEALSCAARSIYDTWAPAAVEDKHDARG